MKTKALEKNDGNIDLKDSFVRLVKLNNKNDLMIV